MPVAAIRRQRCMPDLRWTLWSGGLTLVSMHQANRPLRILALIAAYLVALQALLLPLTVAAGAAYDSSLCVTVQAPDDTPSRHDTGCACAAGCGMQCHSLALAPPLAAGLADPMPQFSAFVAPALIVAVVKSTGHSPPMARAPPAT